jgi:AcrR family transcriptional regulator
VRKILAESCHMTTFGLARAVAVGLLSAVSSTRPTKRPRYGDGKTALLNAVSAVVARSGLRGLTYRAVAAEAGVSHGSVTLHFGSRDAMIEEAYAQAIANSISRSSLEPGTGDISDFVGELAQSVEDDPDAEVLQWELALESLRSAGLAPQMRRMYASYTEAAARELERMGFGDDPVLARFVAGALDGLVFQQTVGLRTRDETEQEIQRLRELLVLALEAKRA